MTTQRKTKRNLRAPPPCSSGSSGRQHDKLVDYSGRRRELLCSEAGQASADAPTDWPTSRIVVARSLACCLSLRHTIIFHRSVSRLVGWPHCSGNCCLLLLSSAHALYVWQLCVIWLASQHASSLHTEKTRAVLTSALLLLVSVSRWNSIVCALVGLRVSTQFYWYCWGNRPTHKSTSCSSNDKWSYG